MGSFLVAVPVGNHQAKDGGGDGYDSRIHQLGQNFYYGFDHGRVHFFCSTAGCLLDGVISAASLATELLAMEAGLAQAARGEIDFIVVARHYTIWTSEDGRTPPKLGLACSKNRSCCATASTCCWSTMITSTSAASRWLSDAPATVATSRSPRTAVDSRCTNCWKHRPTGLGTTPCATVFTEYWVEGGVIRGTRYAVDRVDNSLPGDGNLEAIGGDGQLFRTHDTYMETTSMVDRVHWARYAGKNHTDRQRIKRKAENWGRRYRALP
ncbi:hypothetical protein RM530_13580, partial [Algiphilus sp. W345]|nr:hypothetical protein [Algiphilus sp. W345]